MWTLIALLLCAVPSALPLAKNQQPFWVSQEAAFDAEGRLRPELFPAPVIEQLDALRVQNGKDECRVFSGSPPERYGADDTAEALVRNAHAILGGRVVASEQGFLGSAPGTLYAVQLSERLRSAQQQSSDDVVYLFVNDARIVTPQGLICARTFSDVPSPQVGDRVLFFAYHDPIDAQGALFHVDAATQLVVQSHERLAMPKSLAGSLTSRHWANLVEELRRRMERVAAAK